MTSIAPTIDPEKPSVKTKPGRQSPVDIRTALAKMPGNLKARLVVEALEKDQQVGIAIDKSKNTSTTDGLSEVKQEVSQEMLLGILAEFKRDLDQQHQQKKATLKDLASPTKPTNTGLQSSAKPKSELLPVSQAEKAKALQQEHPAVSAMMLSKMPTDKVKEILHLMKARHAQKTALHLSSIESFNQVIPRQSREVVDALNEPC